MLPDGWQFSRLDELCDVRGGKRLPKGRSLVSNDTGYPYIRVSDMTMGGIATDSIMYVPEDIAPRIANYRVSSSDLFFSVAGTLGLVGAVPAELDGANLTENADKLTNIRINKEYLLYYLQSSTIQSLVNAMKTQNAQPKLALEKVRAFPIAVPPPNEQANIARILSEWDAAIELLRKRLLVSMELKRGLMQVLLTGKKRFKEFSSERWKTVTLGSQLEQIIGGGTPSRTRSDYWGQDGIPWISVKDLRADHISSTVESITDLGLANSSANLIPANTVIIATRMAVGKSVRSSVPAAINQDLKALFPKHTLRADFLHLVAQRAQPALATVATGSTVKGIRLKDLRDITFGLPSTREQQKIAEVITIADQEIENLEKQLEAYKLQKRGLMQQLLTGKKRVNLDKLEPVTT